MTSSVRRFAAACGYLFFSLAMLFLLLLLRFPADRLRGITEAFLSPASLGLTCVLGPAHLFRQGLLLDFVAWSHSGSPTSLLRIEGLRLRPRPDRSAPGQLMLAEWEATVYGSQIHGNLGLAPRRRQFHLTAHIEDLPLERASLLLRELGRTASGRLQADISLVLPWSPPSGHDVAVRLSLRDAHIALRHPLLGMHEVTLERLDSRWRMEEGRWLLEDCAFRSGMGRGECGGSVRPLPPPAWGQLTLHGIVFPPADLLMAIVPARSRQIPGGGWPFTLAGTMELPNFIFN